jgi:cytochrome c-type biogenesis protein CcmH/NrfG
MGAMKNQSSNKTSGWTNVQVYTAIAVVLVLGGLGGYLLHSSGTPAESSSSATASVPSIPPAVLAQQALDAQTKPLLRRIDGNPKDVAALAELGNIYFDASQFPTAIDFYTRALNEAPNDADVRTDMGICYFYSGDPDRALKEFDKALKGDPRHVQTLFNVGIVKLNGKNDPKGAIVAWESLLKINPTYKDRAKVESLLADAKAKVK